jgi:hypothetical protein
MLFIPAVIVDRINVIKFDPGQMPRPKNFSPTAKERILRFIRRRIILFDVDIETNYVTGS